MKKHLLTLLVMLLFGCHTSKPAIVRIGGSSNVKADSLNEEKMFQMHERYEEQKDSMQMIIEDLQRRLEWIEKKNLPVTKQ